MTTDNMPLDPFENEEPEMLARAAGLSDSERAKAEALIREHGGSRGLFGE